MMNNMKRFSIALLLTLSIVLPSSFAIAFTGFQDAIDHNVLQLALKAYDNALRHGIHDDKHVLTIIDYSLPSTTNRLWVIDVDSKKVLFSSLVAHGKGSGDNFATHFSNSARTLASSIGLFLTERTYMGKHGYSLKIKGLENGFNDRAEERSIVIHPAAYVSEATVRVLGRLGRSWGCPALDEKVSKPIINTIKDGTLVFAYYPDNHWLRQSTFLN